MKIGPCAKLTSNKAIRRESGSEASALQRRQASTRVDSGAGSVGSVGIPEMVVDTKASIGGATMTTQSKSPEAKASGNSGTMTTGGTRKSNDDMIRPFLPIDGNDCWNDEEGAEKEMFCKIFSITHLVLNKIHLVFFVLKFDNYWWQWKRSVSFKTTMFYICISFLKRISHDTVTHTIHLSTPSMYDN